MSLNGRNRAALRTSGTPATVSTLPAPAPATTNALALSKTQNLLKTHLNSNGIQLHTDSKFKGLEHSSLQGAKKSKISLDSLKFQVYERRAEMGWPYPTELTDLIDKNQFLFIMKLHNTSDCTDHLTIEGSKCSRFKSRE